MDHYERELIVGQIRSGYMYLSRNIKLKPMSIDLYNESMFVYREAYTEALSQELMTLEDSFKFLENTGIITFKNKIDLETLEKTLEDAQEELYQERKDKKKLKDHKKRIGLLKNKITQMNSVKYSLHENTCENFAETKRLFWLLPKLSLCRGKRNRNSRYLQSLYHQSVFKDSIIRDLSLNDPWRSLWVLKDFKPLFYNHEHEFNINQKNIMLWSITYDNIRQSMDSPEDDFYEDHDVIDAWFVWSRRKVAREKLKEETEAKLAKHNNNSDHVVLMESEDLTNKEIYDLNETKQRMYVQNLQKEILDSEDETISWSNTSAEKHAIRTGDRK